VLGRCIRVVQHPTEIIDSSPVWIRILRENSRQGRVDAKTVRIIRRTRRREVYVVSNSCIVMDDELTSLESSSRNGCGSRQRGTKPLIFAIEEEEGFVLDYRSTNRVPEVVADIGIHLLGLTAGIDCGIEPIARP